jgi:hypothetical protein
MLFVRAYDWPSIGPEKKFRDDKVLLSFLCLLWFSSFHGI